MFKEKSKVSFPLALAASIVCMITVFLTFSYLYGIQENVTASGELVQSQSSFLEILYLIVNLIFFLLQILLFLDWSSVLNNRIKDISFFISNYMEKAEDREIKNDFMWLFEFLQRARINVLPLSFYVICSLLGLVFSSLSLIMSFVGFVFLCFYLQNLFNSCLKLQDFLSQFYNFYLPSDKNVSNLAFIFKPRGIFLFMILTFITGTLYWCYFFLKMALEINLFLSLEKENRLKATELFSIDQG